MLILDSPSSDPRFNMAAEEYLLKETDREYAFFYINDPSVIIGKHQNAWAEVDLPWTRQHNIPVVRRMSGGGTVWHDHGNLNFSFIRDGEEGKLVNFREYAAPVMEFLKGIGIPAEFGGRNEMLAGGLKISGNAEHVHRKRVLHHGTLLFSSDLSMLQNALNTDPDMYEDKAVQSIRSKVGNIRDFLKKPMEIDDFRRQLIAHTMFFSPGSKILALTDDETQRIQELVRDKYGLWKWNIGYSPKYKLRREWMIGRIRLKAELLVEKGHIIDCRLTLLATYPAHADIPSGESIAPDLLNGEHITQASDYGRLDDILSGETLMPYGQHRIPAGNEHRLKDLAANLVGLAHDPDALCKYLSERDLVKPGWIDAFVKGLF